jgi:hypothetical protein
LLRLDILVPGRLECLGLATERHQELPVVGLLDRANRLEQREDVSPIDVVTDGVAKNLGHRVAMMAVEMDWSRR